jgi:TonB family protein
MNRISACLTAVVLLVAGAPAQQSSKKPADEEVRKLKAKCKATILKRNPQKEPQSFAFARGEKYKNSPVVSFSISEDGSVSNVRLKRSSGVKSIDEYAIQSVKSVEYKPMPGCPGIESQADVTIHFQ